jgi:peptidylprolyl isomerase
MRRFLALCAVLALGLPLAAPAAPTQPPKTSAKAKMTVATVGKTVTTPSGLRYIDLVVGKGPMPKAGQTISVLYTGKLTDGKIFDSTSTRNNEPFETPIGVGQVIKGWDEGMLTMRVGGKRRLTIPPNLGYGSVAEGPIPANSTLIFDVQLLAIK